MEQDSTTDPVHELYLVCVAYVMHVIAVLRMRAAFVGKSVQCIVGIGLASSTWFQLKRRILRVKNAAAAASAAASSCGIEMDGRDEVI